MQHTATPLTEEDSKISRAIKQMTRSVYGGVPLADEPPEKKKFSFFR